MWRHILFLVVLSAGAVGLSLVLVPRDQEIALMFYKDEQFEAALKRFEHQYFENPGDTRLLLPLHDLYLREGMVEDAIAVVGRAVEVRPDDPESLQLALDLYYETYRADAFRDALVARARLTGEIEDVRRAADQHRFDSKPEAEVEMRLLLIDTLASRRAAALAAPANALLGNGDEAAEAAPAPGLSEAEIAHADANFARAMELLATLDRVDEAVDRIRNRVTDVGPPADAGQMELLVTIAAWGGAPDVARASLIAWLDLRRDGPGLLEAGTWLDSVDDPAALAEALGTALGRRYRSDGEWIETVESLGALPRGNAILAAAIDAIVGSEPAAPGIHLDWFDFALGNGLHPQAAALLGAAPAGAVRTALMATATEQASDLPAGIVSLLLSALTEDLPVADALGAVELALAGSAWPAALERLAAIDPAEASGSDRIRLADAWSRAGSPDRAVALLDDISPTAVRTLGHRVALAGVYRAAGRAEEGFTLLGEALRTSGDATAVEAWALLAVAAGRPEVVTAWMDDLTPGAQFSLGKDFLLALADTASAVRAPGVEQRAVDLLRNAANDEDSALALAEALGRIGRWREALGILDAFGTSADARDRGDALLIAALGRDDDAEVGAALGQRLQARITALGTDAEPVTRLVNDLLAVDGDRYVVPALATLAEADPRTWYETFRASALRTGAAAGLAELAGDLLLAADARSAEPAFAQRLLADVATGADGAQALSVLGRRLEAAAPDDPAVLPLLYTAADFIGADDTQPFSNLLAGRLAQPVSTAERSAISSLLAGIDDDGTALAALRAQALRDDLAEVDESAAWFAWRNAALVNDRRDEVVDVLRSRLAAATRGSERHQRLVFDLGELTDKTTMLAWLAEDAEAPGISAAERAVRFDRLRDAGLAAGDVSAAIAMAEARVEAANNADEALTWLDALASLGVGTVAASERWLAEASFADQRDTALYYRFRDTALAEGERDRLLAFLERQLATGRQRGLFSAELASHAPPERALSVLRAEADRAIGEDHAEEAYYAYQTVALGLDAQDGSERPGRDHFIVFLDESLARDDLPVQTRVLHEFDLGRLAGTDALLDYLADRAGRDLPAEERERAYAAFVGAITESGLVDRFAGWVDARLRAQPRDPLALRYLDDLIATAGPAAALPALEARARQDGVDITERAEAWFRLKSAAIAANATERLAAFVEERLQAGDRSAAWSIELQTLAGAEAALPWLEAEAETEHRADGPATTAYYRFLEAANEARRTEVFTAFLMARLDEMGPEHPRLQLYEYDLQRLAEPAITLAWLESRATDPEADAQTRRAYYERFREAAREANALDRVVAFVETRLAELERGAADANAADTVEYFLDELAAVTDPEQAAERFEARVRDTALAESRRLAAWYRLKALGESAGLKARLVVFLRERLDAEFREPWVSEFRAVAGDREAAGEFRRHVRRTDLDAEQRELAYYAFQGAAEAAGRQSTFVAFLTRGLADPDLSAATRTLYEYDLERLAAPEQTFDYLLSRVADTGFDFDTRAAYLARLRELALARELVEPLGAALRDLAENEPTGPLASLMLSGVAAAEGPASVLDLLRERALDPTIGLETRTTAYAEFKQAAIDAGRLDLVTDFVRDQLASDDQAVRDLYLLELRLVAGDEQALPWLEAEAARDDLGPERGRAAYYAFAETAVNSANTRRLIDFLDTRLADSVITHPLRETWVYELQRLSGPAAVLPHLRRAVESTDSPEDARLAAYYAYRAASEEAGEMGAYLDAIGEWLTAGLGTTTEHAAWLYDLRQLGGPKRVLPWLQREAVLAEAAGGDEALDEAELAEAGASYYAFADAAGEADSPEVLVAFLVERLRTDALPRWAEKLYLDAIVVEAEPEVALRALAPRADSDPELHGPAYAELLRRSGRIEELTAFALEKGLDDTLPAATRQQFADVLLGAGAKAQAIAVLRPLSAAAGSEAPVTEYLMYVLGPRPGSEAIDWMVSTAKASRGDDRTGWASRLQNVGAPREAVALLRPDDNAWPGPLALQAYVDSLAVARDREELALFLDRFIAAPSSTAMLRWAGTVAEEAGFEPQASQAWRSLLERRPRDLDALRRLGFLAYARGRRQEAERTLGAVLARADDDYEGHFFYGELLLARGQQSRAQRHYRRSLMLIENGPSPDFRKRTVRAQALQRLGRSDAALAAFEKLVAERPDEGHLRADYVNVLLDAERVVRARQALGGASQDRKTLRRSGTRRP